MGKRSLYHSRRNVLLRVSPVTEDNSCLFYFCTVKSGPSLWSNLTLAHYISHESWAPYIVKAGIMQLVAFLRGGDISIFPVVWKDGPHICLVYTSPWAHLLFIRHLKAAAGALCLRDAHMDLQSFTDSNGEIRTLLLGLFFTSVARQLFCFKTASWAELLAEENRIILNKNILKNH